MLERKASAFSSVKMWQWALLWQASTLLIVGGTLDFRFLNQRRQYAPSSQVSCFEYTFPTDRFGKALDKAWRPEKIHLKNVYPSSTTPTYTSGSLLNINEINRRIDRLLPDGKDIVKEHAKLVQDINSLRQVLFVAPLADENKDYDDSILHEIIETSTTTTPRPTTIRPIRSTKPSSIPVILLGGASQRQIVKSAPIKFSNPTINLVGTSVSPLVKHPYPFIMQPASRKPIKVCMTSMPTMYTTTSRRPSLWQRLLSSLIPR